MTLMCIPVCSDIGLEIHPDTDQIIRIEQGMALVKMGHHKNELNFQFEVCDSDIIFVPAGTWHNVFYPHISEFICQIWHDNELYLPVFRI